MKSILSQKTTYFPFFIFHLSFVIWLLLYLGCIPDVSPCHLLQPQTRAYSVRNDK